MPDDIAEKKDKQGMMLRRVATLNSLEWVQHFSGGLGVLVVLMFWLAFRQDQNSFSGDVLAILIFLLIAAFQF